ncbi:TIGR04139 family peptide modification target [Chryseobacterium sp. DT-3]|uniref:TIGR04139 family peptide modification target n=1 Tax=Chryseobacterium sp. DT-3 TaxID=3396164 RepID=UPI003F1D66F7
MKKLQGMKNGFSSLENKKMNNLGTIIGGSETSRTSSQTLCGNNCSDTEYYKDGVKTMTLTIEGANPTAPY